MLHFHQGLGLLGRWGDNGELEKIEIYSWPKIKSRLAQLSKRTNELWVAVSMDQMEEECARNLLEILSETQRIPFGYFAERRLAVLPRYADIAIKLRTESQMTWKVSELQRYADYRRDLIEMLYESDAEEIRELTDEQLLANLQVWAQGRTIYQVRMKQNGWTSVSLSFDANKALERHAALSSSGKCAQVVSLFPTAKNDRAWRIIHRVGDKLYFQCGLTLAFGIIQRNRLNPREKQYLEIHPDSADIETRERSWVLPQTHNFLVELLSERKAVFWNGEEWAVITGERCSLGRIILDNGSQSVVIVEIEPGLFVSPDHSGLSETLIAGGYFVQEGNSFLRLVDPELKLELLSDL